MNNKILSWTLKLPIILLTASSMIGAFYAAYKNIAGVTYATPTIITIIFISYFIGEYLYLKKEVKNARNGDLQTNPTK